MQGEASREVQTRFSGMITEYKNYVFGTNFGRANVLGASAVSNPSQGDFILYNNEYSRKELCELFTGIQAFPGAAGTGFTSYTISD